MYQNHWFEDFSVGARFVSQGCTVTESAIIDFAFRYDPQPFHLDAGAAARSPYGGLIASGFQTIALCFRLFIQSGIIIESSIGSPGLDELRWLAPVRPEDTLHTEVEVLELKPSRSKPDRGIVRMRYEAINQRGEKVLSFIANHLLLKRPA
ncbi:MAG: MaoC family dehydratase [Zoogloeaceae bacterium]|nr:MaoC family dehydratase [Rhodocyclaceae bacterium]MCP5232678.1 MaoC family dehydratase [Zoogloeaceae bacterium]MCP5238816.1 MaoC family dehydratase [Zoogloeaceae bacterium]MCP5254297.1 MaoC family dehydratase [Zoogloeaceae bacterium]MCW5614169.1 MaoC family dehydratase [Rhodocyclaceae bacterium]